jgi:hypothetical protein
LVAEAAVWSVVVALEVGSPCRLPDERVAAIERLRRVRKPLGLPPGLPDWSGRMGRPTFPADPPLF